MVTLCICEEKYNIKYEVLTQSVGKQLVATEFMVMVSYVLLRVSQVWLGNYNILLTSAARGGCSDFSSQNILSPVVELV